MIVYLVLAESTGSGRFNWYKNFDDAVKDIHQDIPSVNHFTDDSFAVLLKSVNVPEHITDNDDITHWIDINIIGNIDLSPEVE